MSSTRVTAAGFTPSKIVLIGCLSLVLVGTLIYQMTSSGAAPRAIHKRAPRSTDANPAPPPAEMASSSHVLRAVGGKWPHIAVSEASRFDPFAFPDALLKKQVRSANPGGLTQPLQIENSEKSAGADSTELAGGKTPPSGKSLLADGRPQEMKRRLEEQRAVAAELARRGVGVVFQTSQGSVARLGDLEVRVGDVLNGLRVVEINSDGIRLVPEAEDQGPTTQ